MELKRTNDRILHVFTSDIHMSHDITREIQKNIENQIKTVQPNSCAMLLSCGIKPALALDSKDVQHLQWVYARLKNVHNEDENLDYMLALKRIIEKEYYN